MMLTHTRGRPLWRVLVTATALVAATLALGPAAAEAAETGTVETGTASWGLSTYLNSANPGRPNPLPTAYTAPAEFDAGTRITSWATGTGTVAPDGSASLALDGTSVNFAKTGGGWLRLTEPEVVLDASGNGTVSAVVAYGTSVTGTPGNLTYDPAQAPARGPERVTVVDLAGNTPGDASITPTTATWTGLDGSWSAAFLDFLDGDSAADPAIPGWSYAATVSSATDRIPRPFTFSVTTEAPEVSATVASASYDDGLGVDVSGSGFRPVTNPGDAGVYVGIAASGGLPDVSSPSGMDAFTAAAYVSTGQIVDGAFSTTLDAPTTALDPSTSYSVYTWQAHTHSNTSQDTETPVSITWSALQPPQPDPTPAVTVTTTGSSYADGLGLTVSGQHFRAVTNPGDAGVYAGLAPVGGLPDVSTPAGMGAFAAVAHVAPGRIVDGAFTTALDAPASALDPSTSYAVYTWQAHTHSNTSQDTQTPVSIDWASLEGPAATELTASGPSTTQFGEGAALVATVSAGTGTVTLRGVGPEQTAPVVGGRASFTVPASLGAGSHTAAFAYSGDETHQASEATHALTVTRATPSVGAGWDPRVSRTTGGKLKVRVEGVEGLDAPTGAVRVELLKNGELVRSLPSRQLEDGRAAFSVGRVGKARWKVRVLYLGADDYTAARRVLTFQVR